jgi:hypothetical protein
LTAQHCGKDVFVSFFVKEQGAITGERFLRTGFICADEWNGLQLQFAQPTMSTGEMIARLRFEALIGVLLNVTKAIQVWPEPIERVSNIRTVG